MNCLEVRDSLSAWLDGELAPEVLVMVDRHLESCVGCRRELAQLQALDQALEALDTPAPAGLPERVRARLRRPPRRRWQSLALAASVVLGILLGGAMARDFYPVPQENGFGTEVASLEAFHDFPQGSLGLILASYQEDEGSDNGK
ncbi:MAG TPA: zf-HC2 domain-containing protein [Desulfobaccales bacterium]